MWKLGVTALALGLTASAAGAFEWNGFQSGMTPEQVRDAAAAQGLALDREPDAAPNVTVPLYAEEGGGSAGFLAMCDGRLARIGTELQELDIGRVARSADEYGQYGEGRVRTMTMQTGARGLELLWSSGEDEIGIVLVSLGNQQLMQETRADVALWELCADGGFGPGDEEPVDEAGPAEEEGPATPEELILDALGRALRGEDRDQ